MAIVDAQHSQVYKFVQIVQLASCKDTSLFFWLSLKQLAYSSQYTLESDSGARATSRARSLWPRRAAQADAVRPRPSCASTGAPAAWDSETGVWVGVAKKTKPDGVPKPRGRAPLGAEWNYETGEWEGGAKTSAKKKK